VSRPLVHVKTVTKTDAAYRTIRLAIEEGDLKPGERLTVTALEEWLGMSPTPIREALRLLQADGIVQHTPHHGMVVAVFSPEAILEVYRLRIPLESLAAEWAAERAHEGHLNQLRRIHKRFERAVAQNPAGSDVAALNAAWHAMIYETSASPTLAEFIERLWNSGGGKAMWISGRAHRAVAEHAQILAALEARDGKCAAELMRKHIGGGAMMHRERLREAGHDVSDEEFETFGPDEIAGD
jgi:DNA-binding GntR family transcriptional regulator